MNESLFQTLARELGRAGIPHLLIGGVAVNQYGISRSTQDVDLAIHNVENEDFTALIGRYGNEHIHEKIKNHVRTIQG